MQPEEPLPPVDGFDDIPDPQIERLDTEQSNALIRERMPPPVELSEEQLEVRRKVNEALRARRS